MTDKNLLDTIGSTDLGNLLDNFGIIETTIATDDEE